MLDGFKFDVAAAEARTHFRLRSAHHAGKAEEIVGKIAALGEARKSLRDAVGVTQAYGMARDDSDSLEGRAKAHRHKSLVFDWLASHIPDGETFRVSVHDAGAMEFGLGANEEAEGPYGFATGLRL